METFQSSDLSGENDQIDETHGQNEEAITSECKVMHALTLSECVCVIILLLKKHLLILLQKCKTFKQ